MPEKGERFETLSIFAILNTDLVKTSFKPTSGDEFTCTYR